MSDDTSPTPSTGFSPFSKLLSVLGLLAIALYFTGWVYRWAYFSFFEINLTSFDLPRESFFLAAFQVFFGHPFAIIRAAVVIIASIMVGIAVIWLRQRLASQLPRRAARLVRLIPTAPSSFLTAIVDEIIIALVCLSALFWLAQWQANADAWKDAVNETSSLPIVTVVFDRESAVLGRRLDDPFTNPEGIRLIGDANLYNRLLGQELTNTEDPNQPRVWRLLLSKSGALYIFPALPSKDRFLRLPVLIVQSSNSKLTILSPDVSE
ncbi:hypothetical protein S7335_915 [Synechococcus sp. PCC 7335]|uniref:hypothetical protein n=1 Tax=Synechococcus sp. (strain ATCC 29403 / PCC 7335) TaxID=91464 RepID=UPI00017EC49C|nr:hypothetical protein [Synechococcus sp. PCC 7335]EDX82358.1 hypothetical protein S7335_915 [Synechococcus sp. PCC 7335]